MKPGLTGLFAAVLACAQISAGWGALMKEGERLRKEGRYAEALPHYQQAAAAALEPRPAAQAQYRIAEMFEKLGDPAAALLWYKASLDRLRDPDTEAALKRLESARLGQVVKSAEIVSSLNLPATKSQHVMPSIDLPVHFDLDQASLTEEGIQQVSELGKALRDPVFERGRFAIVGHTDKRGSEFHNQDLSERRARTVRDALSTRFGLDPNRFDVVGMGKRGLLFEGDSEEDHRLNRRVEVKWLRE